MFTLLTLAVIGAMALYFTRPQPVPVRVHEVACGLVEQIVANTQVGTVLDPVSLRKGWQRLTH